MSVYEKLMNIQRDLKAPKGKYNSFGKYKYRSAEDILEAVKPLLAKNKVSMVMTDDVRVIDGRFYLEATITLVDVENGDKVSSKALAREQEDKKGMDAAQLTGSVSSYARKYALNGMFAIDDTQDSDSMDNRQEGQNRGKNVPAQPNGTNVQRTQQNTNIPTCVACNNGVAIPAKVANFSLSKYGKILCMKHQEEFKNGGNK